MMRCMLHSSELGPQFWSFALAHAVYVKNRLYHSTLRMTPFQAFTGRRPDLSRLRIFGSRIYARETGQRKAKLDHHTTEGIFIGFTATDRNVYYIDDETGTVRSGQHVIFDEAHMTVPARYAPLAAQALQRLGYHANESLVQDIKHEESQSQEKLRVKRTTETAKLPTRGTEESVGYDVYLDQPQVTIQPRQIELLPTRISATPPTGTYIQIAPRSGLTVKKHLHTLAGVVDPDYRGNITVVIIISEQNQLHSNEEIKLLNSFLKMRSSQKLSKSIYLNQLCEIRVALAAQINAHQWITHQQTNP